MSKIIAWQKRSTIGEPHKICRIVWSMGFRKLNTVKEFKDNNCIRGMLNKVKHLVAYELKD